MIVDPSAATAAEQGRRSVAAAGESLGKYRLDRVLGAGGMGIVWAAFDPDLERAVALKLLHSSDVPTLRSRLLREARAMARLKHPNVLTVYEVGTDQNRDYIAMEIVDGETLDSWLDSKPAQDEIVGALVAAGRGLMAAHAAGLIHRDFKPHNVLRSKEGHVYVTDFGLARGQIEDGAELEQIAVSTDSPRPLDVLVSPLTQTGVMIGTPAYMAPEQFAGRTPDARTDQFAFCVTAWEALSGARPFRGESLPELERAASGGARELTSTLPPRIRDVLARGLEASPDARWPDLKSLLAALEAAIVPPKPESRWGLVAIIAGGALVAGGIGVFFATRGPSQKQVAAAKAGCIAGETAFANAWSPAKRAALRGHIEMTGHLYILDALREHWLKDYAAACSAPPSLETTKQIECLLRVRDDTAESARILASSDERISVPQIAALETALATCVGRRADTTPFIDIGELIKSKMRIEEAEPPEPPDPPDPPDIDDAKPKPPATPWTK